VPGTHGPSEDAADHRHRQRHAVVEAQTQHVRVGQRLPRCRADRLAAALACDGAARRRTASPVHEVVVRDLAKSGQRFARSIARRLGPVRERGLARRYPLESQAAERLGLRHVDRGSGQAERVLAEVRGAV
jgi:hypothetical protein